ncbi:putative molybdenum cofactor [Peziza echinospora]|nr:putative molybdenum cofactor [Peziza echinospora]
MTNTNTNPEQSVEQRLRDLEAENERLRAQLSLDEYKRYGRQMIVPYIGLPGQLRLKSSSILIIGAGGLGCPAGSYIAGAGIGTLGICDGDTVETSNLHRQIAHSTARVGMTKVDSIIESMHSLNPHVTFHKHPAHLDPSTAAETIAPYDLVLDCTDHPTARYLISDTCVLLGKPLISASALRTEGQLSVLNNPPGIGACYRCIWPKPPPAESIITCGEGGIIGPVVGVMGVLMAVEAIKLLTSNTTQEEQMERAKKTNMLLYSAYSSPMFRELKLRGKKKGCAACDSEARTITLDSLKSGSVDYVAFCGVRQEDRVTEEEKINVVELSKKKQNGEKHVLIDVREEVEAGICGIGGINIPIKTFLQSLPLSHGNDSEPKAEAHSKRLPPWLPEDRSTPVYIVCKQGNDSQIAVKHLKRYLASLEGTVGSQENLNSRAWEGGIWDVKGGLVSWRKCVDGKLPDY